MESKRSGSIARWLAILCWLLLPFASDVMAATLWTPASPGAPAMRLWLDAADSSTLTTTGSGPTVVTDWNDKSGHGNNATASGGTTPALTTLNGHNALDFGAFCYGCGTNPYMVFNSAVTTAQTVFMIWGSANGGAFMLASAGSYGWHRSAPGAGSSASDPIFDNVNGWSDGNLRTGDAITDLNGSAVDPTSTGLSGNWDLISVRSSTGNPVEFDTLANDRGIRTGGLGIAELIAIDARADTATVQRIEGYLAWKWGLQAKLPTNHPYYSHAPVVGPMALYHLDETSYSGAAGEVIDSSGNGLNGKAIGSPLPVPLTSSPAIAGSPGTCGNALFQSQQAAITLSGLPVHTDAGAQTSVAFWMYWDGTDNEMLVGWNSAGGDSLYFNYGYLGFYTQSDVYGISSSGMANGWHHIVAVFTNGNVTLNQLYVDGANQTLSDVVGGGYGAGNGYVASTLQVSGWPADGNWRFTGRLDEVQVFDGALTQIEVNTLYAQTHTCPPPPAASLVAQYHFEESSWNGTSGEVKDSSGNNYNGTAAGSPLPTVASASPAKTGNPGSCNYASFPGPASGNSVINVTGLPVATAAGAQTSMTFWVYWTGANDSMPVYWGTEVLFFYNGYLGFNSYGSGDVRGVSASGLVNGWHHIAVVFTNNAPRDNLLYIDGVLQTLTQVFGTSNPPNAAVSSSLVIGAYSSFNYTGLLDEVSIYNNALTSAQITTIMAATHTCPNTFGATGSFNAFESSYASGTVTGNIHTKVAASSFGLDVIAYDTGTSAIAPSFTGAVKIELLDASNNTGSLDATTQCRSSWSAISGNPGATLAFASGDAGRKSVNLSEGNAWRDTRLRMSYPATGTATNVACSSDDFAIRPNAFGGFSVTDATPSTAGTARTLANVSATGGNVHKAGQPFTIAATAVNAASATTTGYSGTPATVISNCTGSACVGGAAWTNVASEGQSFSFSGTRTVRYGANSNYYTAALTNGGVCNATTFGGDPLPYVAKTCDVQSGGSLTITTDASSGSSAVWEMIAYQGGAFSFAGTQTVRYGANSSYYTASFTNPSGVVCTTTSFGGDPLPYVTKHCDTLSGVTPAASAGDIGVSATYSEVGSFALQLLDSTYASVDAADGSSSSELTIASPIIDVGRFVPDHFDVTSLAAPTLRTFDSSSCGARSFTYIGQAFGFANTAQANVIARNAGGVTTTLYAGALWKLTSSSVTQGYTPTPSTPALITTATTSPTLTSNSDGTGLLVSAASDKLNFVRSNSAPINPFNASIALSWSETDTSEAGVTGNGNISTTTPLVFSNITFDAGNAMRYGMLKLTPAYGSELVNLPVPIESQYWDGVRLATNAADQCTSVPVNAVTMGNYQRSLSACKTALGSANITLANGRGYLKLVKPGSGNSGSVDLTLQLGASASGQTCATVGGASTATSAAALPWLQGRWNGATTFDQNPSTRASFGRYGSPLIYQREMY